MMAFIWAVSKCHSVMNSDRFFSLRILPEDTKLALFIKKNTGFSNAQSATHGLGGVWRGTPALCQSWPEGECYSQLTKAFFPVSLNGIKY